MKRILLATALLSIAGLAVYQAGGGLWSDDPPVDLDNAGAADAAVKGAVSFKRLIGTSVINPLDEDIGEVADLVLDDDGCATGMVVRIGGFMGIGSEYVRLPLGRVSIEPRNPDTLVVLVRETRQNMLSSGKP